jgi:hypothetical protein
MANGREKASQERFFESERRKDTPQPPIVAADTLRVKKKP